MGVRMIPVRHKETGQETQIGESAWPYFAGAYERLDQPADEQPAVDQPNKQARQQQATTSDKEK